jgi:hypothetical protein
MIAKPLLIATLLMFVLDKNAFISIMESYLLRHAVDACDSNHTFAADT